MVTSFSVGEQVLLRIQKKTSEHICTSQLQTDHEEANKERLCWPLFFSKQIYGRRKQPSKRNVWRNQVMERDWRDRHVMACR